jgi:NADPH:quinone reductase-like Zn-dependent oxidoreductase
MPRVLTFTEYGAADVLQVTDVPLAEPGSGQIRVRVHASGVNAMDWKIRRGYMSGGKPIERPMPTGLEFAGVVDALGADVTDFAVGDRVAGGASGTAAEYVLVEQANAVLLPDDIDFVTGASIKVIGTTAIRVLTLAGVREGQTLLLHAATGGVGLFTTQLARARDATVIGTTSERNVDYLASLGAIPVLYGDGWVDRVRAVATGPIDSVIDCSGAGVIAGSLELVVPGGPVVTIADFAASGPGVVITDGSEPGFEDSLREAVKAVEHGTAKIPIEKTFRLDQAADAYRLSESGHVRGKIVLTID